MENGFFCILAGDDCEAEARIYQIENQQPQASKGQPQAPLAPEESKERTVDQQQQGKAACQGQQRPGPEHGVAGRRERTWQHQA